MNGISRKTVIVTGGAMSIGAAIVRVFHQANANVVICDSKLDEGNRLALELGDRALFCETDITNDAQIQHCLQRTHAQFNRVDFLVNNAAIYLDNGMASSREDWLHAINANVVSGAIFAREAAIYIRQQGGGAIVNLSSVAGKIGQAGRALYPLCKAAISQVTRSEAAEWAKDNIRVNSVSPGWTHSTTLANLSGHDTALADRAAAPLHPMGRAARAEEIAQTVLYLCSDAASFVTGIDLPVDGGYSMLGPDQGHSTRYWLDKAKP